MEEEVSKLPNDPEPEPSSPRGKVPLILVILFASFVSTASAVTFWKYFHGFKSKNPNNGFTPPDTIDEKFRDALNIAMQFFDVQKCIGSCLFISLFYVLIISAYFVF